MTTGSPARRVLALVPDLMDRSRLSTAGVEVELVGAAELAAALDERRRAGEVVAMVVVDLSRPGALDAVIGVDATVVGFAPHVDDELLARAEAAGVMALPRSKFFARWPDVAR
jgi:hypothetical protein